MNRIHLTSFRLCFPHFSLVPPFHLSPSRFVSFLRFARTSTSATATAAGPRAQQIFSPFLPIFLVLFSTLFPFPNPSSLASLCEALLWQFFRILPAQQRGREVKRVKRGRESTRNKSKLCSAGAGTEQIPSQIQICDFKLIPKAAVEQPVASLIQLPIFGYLMHLFMDFEIVLCSARAAKDGRVWFLQSMMGCLYF